jgi:hypothetical protein
MPVRQTLHGITLRSGRKSPAAVAVIGGHPVTDNGSEAAWLGADRLLREVENVTLDSLADAFAGGIETTDGSATRQVVKDLDPGTCTPRNRCG